MAGNDSLLDLSDFLVKTQLLLAQWRIRAFEISNFLP